MGDVYGNPGDDAQIVVVVADGKTSPEAVRLILDRWASGVAHVVDWTRGSTRCTQCGSPPISRSGFAEVLTAREREVVALAVRGRSNREIAEQIVVTVSTVKHHMSNALKKVGARNRQELVAMTFGTSG